LQEAEELQPRLEAAILDLLGQRAAGKTICPSEVARAVAGSQARSMWEPLMEPTRQAAGHLVNEGRLVITQHGRVIDGATAKGPVRLRLR
jgi:hypothetical protein